jgi:hypothetical protein
MPKLGLGLSLPTRVPSSFHYTNKLVLTGQAVANGTYTRPKARNDKRNADNSLISFTTGTKTISNVPYDNEHGAFLGWYMYDSSLSDPGFPRYQERSDALVPTSFSPVTSTKSFTVSGLQTAVNGTYSRTAGNDSSFYKSASPNPIFFSLIDEGWYIFEPRGEMQTHVLYSDGITTSGWQRIFLDKVTLTGPAGIASGVYTYSGFDDSYQPLLTGVYNFHISWDTLFCLNASYPESIMTTTDGGATWTSTAPCAQFVISGLTGFSTDANGTYKFSQRLTDAEDSWYYTKTTNNYIICRYDVTSQTWVINYDPYNLLSKSGTSPVGTWTKLAGQTGTATGGSVVAMTATGVAPTLTISSIVNVSGPSPAPTITPSGG